ncbi:unnamed protein product [Timema podura]|uniref:Uncharacterized protein n=1 Tax=Timema podura TaxID=61482 RepID=A0ABN7NYF3_TIMPD|nr:unnamed protein product [Timema podura]
MVKEPEPDVNNIPESSNGNQQHEYSGEIYSTGSQHHVSYVNPQPIHNREIHQFGSNIKGQKLFCHSLERQMKNNSFEKNNKIGPSQYCNEFQRVCINDWSSSCGSSVGVLCNNEYEMMDKNETKIEIKNESFALCNNVHYTAPESSECGVNNDDNTFQCLVTVHRSMSQ